MDAADNPPPVRGDQLQEGIFVLAATDPANPYGAATAWPAKDSVPMRPQRVSGARVVLDRGQLTGYLSRTGQHLLTFLPESEPEGEQARRSLIQTLADLAEPGSPVLLAKIDGDTPDASPLSPGLVAAGFTPTSRGYLRK
jgi:ATP-dependent Lhr-like helicase